MTTNKYYDRLIQLQKEFPALTFDNVGYQTTDLTGLEDQVAEISEIMKIFDRNFTEFQNFKPRKDGTFAIRYQCYYDRVTYFQGVHYASINEFKDLQVD